MSWCVAVDTFQWICIQITFTIMGNATIERNTKMFISIDKLTGNFFSTFFNSCHSVGYGKYCTMEILKPHPIDFSWVKISQVKQYR